MPITHIAKYKIGGKTDAEARLMWRREYVYIMPPTRFYRFSPIEKKHLAISVAALTLAFFVAKIVNTTGWRFELLTANFAILILLSSFLAVFTGFVFHELAHKFIAIKNGCWAEYRMFPQGLALALLLSIFGFIIAAPGAVYISGVYSKRVNGKIALAGPFMNFIIFVISFALLIPILHAKATVLALWIAHIIYGMAYFNIFLAIFNMIPIPPLDGSKVISWSITVYAIFMGIFVASYVIAFHVIIPYVFIS
ncbi:MAG: hypothetical protein DRN20_00310 [Thermoplasmata archaeon]|nr:MAG: hypothetical protein DRN20_00310 [Thermoplasmata archaeon]